MLKRYLEGVDFKVTLIVIPSINYDFIAVWIIYSNSYDLWPLYCNIIFTVLIQKRILDKYMKIIL